MAMGDMLVVDPMSHLVQIPANEDSVGTLVYDSVTLET
jgi:hypothetical protein